MKKAILQVADTGPLESLVIMLRSVGYQCYLPSESLKRYLRSLGCDTVLDISGLMRGWGYSKPMALFEASEKDMDSADLYVDIKAHRNGPLVWQAWPNLRKKTLWYRINGGEPEHVINARGDHGNEIDPPCPVLTPNLWYRGRDRAYSMWPPFYRFGEYPWEERNPVDPPICLIHNLTGWGYGAITDGVRAMGVRCYGAGSPDGLIQHSEVKVELRTAKAMVHLKSSDAPGYALYEALASACPIVCSRRLIWRNRMQDLFVPGETCLVFDRETHEGLTPKDVASCLAEISEALSKLGDAEVNQRMGRAGRERLRALMWDERKEEDTSSLREFMVRNFA